MKQGWIIAECWNGTRVMYAAQHIAAITHYKAKAGISEDGDQVSTLHASAELNKPGFAMDAMGCAWICYRDSIPSAFALLSNGLRLDQTAMIDNRAKKN